MCTHTHTEIHQTFPPHLTLVPRDCQTDPLHLVDPPPPLPLEMGDHRLSFQADSLLITNLQPVSPLNQRYHPDHWHRLVGCDTQCEE